MPSNPEQFNPEGNNSSELEKEELAGQENLEYTEDDLKKMVQEADTQISSEENEVLENAQQRIDHAPESSSIDPQKAESIFVSSGIAERVTSIKEKIVSLGKSTKEKISSLFSNQPEVIHFSEMATTPAENVPQTETPTTEAVQDKQEVELTTPEQPESQESQEQKDLREYLEKEVFSKFGLAAEDQQRVLAEASEERREVLERSFENSRKSLETFYNEQVIDGVIDGYAAGKAQKQLNYEILNPILENSLVEIQPKLAELDIELSQSLLGFNTETADHDKLNSALSDFNYEIKSKITDKVRGRMVESLMQNGEYKGITLVTEEQKKDGEFMEKRSSELQSLERQAINEELEKLGFSTWLDQTKDKLDKPYMWDSEKSVDEITGLSVNANEYKIYKTKEEVTEMLGREKDLAEKTNFLCVNIDANKFEKVLAEEGFRDIFSLNEVELAEMKRAGRGDEFYMNQRKTIEDALGVYNPEKPTIYGTYASENGIDEGRGGADVYGSIFLKLKPSVEATFCEGDSMSGMNHIASQKLSKVGLSSSSDWALAAQARQIAPEHASLVKGMNNAYRQVENQCGRGVSSFDYLEAHIKGLNIEDIESINIPKSVMDFGRYNIDKGDPSLIISKLQQDPKWKDKINIIE